MADPTSDTEQPDDFEDTPSGWASRWKAELETSDKELQSWHKAGEEVEKRYRCEDVLPKEDEPARWELFTANVENQRRQLYAQVPKVTVSRRFMDADDDDARVAAVMMERLLNTDIERASDTFAQALGHAVDDRLLPGLGAKRVRYETGPIQVLPGKPAMTRVDPATGAVVEIAPAVPDVETKPLEDACVDYVHWRDFRWSPCRTWEEVRWVAFGCDMSRRQLVKRFGEEIGRAVPLKNRRPGSEDGPTAQPWGRARVWEVWSKEDDRQVFWWAEGYPTILDRKQDPLGLENFFPCCQPLLSLATSSTLVPRPPYVLAQDLYREINNLTGRIRELQESVVVRGVYDKAFQELGTLLSGGKSGELIPVEMWAKFMERGGFAGAFQMLPLADMVAAMDKLRDLRSEDVAMLMQVTGDSDLVRGQQLENGTPGEAAVKARFASLRGQSLQDKVAEFAAGTLRLRAEIISKHFDVATIVARSNILMTTDAPRAERAARLIKERLFWLRIEVKPEAVGMADFAAIKSERLEVVQAIGEFVQATLPVAQTMPGSMPFLLKVLRWAVASLKGSQEIEGVIDSAVDAATEQAKQPQQAQGGPPPDMSKLMAEQAKQRTVQAKSQADLAKVDAELRADLARSQADVQAEEAKQRAQTVWNAVEERNRKLAATEVPVRPPPAAPFGGL
jgi:hypothetical protein